MIHIQDKSKCCGCAACVQVCPKGCISFNEDEEGFRYPLVDREQCIGCGLCEKVCPVLNQNDPREPLQIYAAKNPNEEIRLKSSSGGIFTMLAESVVDEGGVVFGAKFDENWEVKHDYTETKDGLEDFRGSKYVQSRIGNTYIEVKDFLDCGRKVLFSGTPCQIAGLKGFLGKEYDNLLTVDLICHGVPSPLVWRTYLNDCILHPKGVAGKNSVSFSLKETPIITGISFRDKSTGWKKFGFIVRGKSASKADKNTVLSSIDTKDEVLLHETFDKNLFMQGFLKNLYLRPSCHACSVRCSKSGSDITIADFWGISKGHPEFDDDKGVGLVLINTPIGESAYSKISVLQIESTYKEASQFTMEKSVAVPKYRTTFWKSYKRGMDIIEKLCYKMRPSLLDKGILLTKRIVIALIEKK